MRPKRTGISLFEVTIVMLVLGILAAVAAPRFSDSFQHSKLVAAANQIAGHIDYIRRVAVNEGTTTHLYSDSTTDRYWSDVSVPHRPGQLIDVEIKTVHHTAFELVGDFNGQSSLSFDFEGVPHADGSQLTAGKITIFYKVQSLDIVISPVTGDTTVIDSSPQPDQVEPDDYFDSYGEGYGAGYGG